MIHWNWADYVIIAIIIISAVTSFIRGFVREAISLATWIIAIWLGLVFSAKVGGLFANVITSSTVRLVIGFLIVFFIILIIGAIINYFVTRLIDHSGLSGTDRMLGLIFGVVRGVLMIAILILLANMTTIPKDRWFQESKLIPQFEGLANWLSQFIPKEFDQLENKVKVHKKEQSKRMSNTIKENR